VVSRRDGAVKSFFEGADFLYRLVKALGNGE
jgi:hypothetical protein